MLRLDDIDVHIEGVHVLRGIDLELPAGSTAALIGRNGAGKTTALRTIMGFLPLKSGEIHLGDTRLDTVLPHRRPALGIGYAPEDRRLFASFHVEGNIRLPGEVAGLDRGEIDRRLGEVYEVLPELAELKDRPAGSVSGGQGKMIALGRALMIGTKLILLDEPFQGLAPALAARYAQALKALRERYADITLVVTESNPALIEDIADLTYVIERGAAAKAAGSPA
ncbi:MAG: ABC transporter ATP-binding protein [Geminicoccaceae bacterium]